MRMHLTSASKILAAVFVFAATNACGESPSVAHDCSYMASIRPHDSKSTYDIRIVNDSRYNTAEMTISNKVGDVLTTQIKKLKWVDLDKFCAAQSEIIKNNKNYISIDGPDVNVQMIYNNRTYNARSTDPNSYANSANIAEGVRKFMKKIGINNVPSNSDWSGS